MTSPRDDEHEPTRELLGEAPGLRVQLVTVAPGQRVRWHRHSVVSDTIVAVQGTVVVETRDPAERRALQPGDRTTLPAGTAHTVAGDGGAACRFINVHAGGAYDFQPVQPVDGG